MNGRILSACFLLCISMVLCAFAEYAPGGPQPGDVFKEYYHSCKENGGCNCGGETIRLGSGYGAVSPLSFQPTGDVDLTDATKAEIFIEITECHEGTYGLQAKINDGAWIDPELPVDNFYDMAHFWFPVFPVDLSDVQEGTNTITLQVAGGGSPTPQMLVVGTHLRVYYDPAAKAHVDAQITAPSSGGTVGKEYDLVCSAAGASKVEFLYNGLGVNWEGDGHFTQWHYTYFHGVFERHIGTAESGPDFTVTWNTEWVPDQTGAQIAARVHSDDGTIYMTEAADNIQICRPDMSVEIGIPNPMRGWVTRNSGNVTQNFTLEGDPGNVIGAMVFEKGWGDENSGMSINGTSIGNIGGGGYNFNFTELEITNTGVFQSGQNSIMMNGGGHHGHEADYPGMMTVVQFSASNDCPAVDCRGGKSNAALEDRNFRISRAADGMSVYSVSVSSPGAHSVSIVSPNGRTMATRTGESPSTYHFNELANGVYFARVRSTEGLKTARFVVE
ncbi:MAG: T9SS type A sorting domain-containing protein [Chitinivibrionales bacterium]|nr:T9SS type A sorting domain-containing protein [Chitinivibrionales bacterium]MBD3397324.1 T9SS type A sorting domain-containing protein [Chitinivibrionales bacterium]